MRQLLPDGSVAGTSTDNTAWTAYTPVVSAVTGTITTSSAQGYYKTAGKTVFVRLRITITTNGTGATSVNATLPFTAPNNEDQYLGGVETSLTGKTLRGYVAKNSATVTIRNYDGATYPAASGAVLIIQGAYERQ